MKKLNVAIIGYGLSGRIFHGALLKALVQFKVTHIMTSNSKRQTQALQDFEDVQIITDFEAILLDKTIDLVIITTPNHLHFELAEKALRAYKHVLIEKPFTVTAHDALRLMDTAKEVDKIVTVYHNRRFDSDFKTLTEIINSDQLGRIVEFESHFDRFRNNFKKDAWREGKLPGSGILYDLGPHLIDQALFHFGLPYEVYADISNQRRGQVDDSFEIILYYSELKVTLKAGMLVNCNLPRFILHGTNGSFIKYGLDPQEARLKLGASPSEILGQEPENLYGTLSTTDQTTIVPSEIGDYKQYYQQLYDAIVHNTPLEINAGDAFNVAKVIEAALKSHKEKKRVLFKH